MLTQLLWVCVAIASFPAAAALVFAIERLTAHFEYPAGADRAGRADGRGRIARRFIRRAEPWWWPEFERDFAEYLGPGDGHRS